MIGAALIFPFKHPMDLMTPFGIILRNYYADYRQHFFRIYLKNLFTFRS